MLPAHSWTRNLGLFLWGFRPVSEILAKHFGPGGPVRQSEPPTCEWLILGISWELLAHNYISTVFIISWLIFMIGSNFSVVNYRNWARQARMIQRAEGPCTGTVQFFNLHSCILGRIEDSSLIIKICQSSKVKTFRSQGANFWKEWTWLRYLLISHEAISAGNSPWILMLWVASESWAPFCTATQTSVLNQFQLL